MPVALVLQLLVALAPVFEQLLPLLLKIGQAGVVTPGDMAEAERLHAEVQAAR